MKIKNIIYPISFLLFGLIIFFYPVLFIDKGLMPGDLGDGRFVNYIFEHFFLFLTGNDLHNSFWNLPIFYPNQNTLAYSEIMLGGMMIYFPLRLFFSAQTALQAVIFICCILNFISFYILLKGIFKFKPLSSSLGAFLFAFSIVRYSQIYHLQLFLQFFSIFSLICFLSLKKDNSKIKNNFLFLSGTILFALQCYSNFYLSWFMAFGGVLFIIILFCFKDERKKIIEFIKFYKFELTAYFIILIVLLSPAICHYMKVGAKAGFYLSKLRPIYFLCCESMLDKILFKTPFSINCENNLCLGIITTLAVICGIVLDKRKRKFIFIFLFVSILIFSILSFKALIYFIFPGAGAIRAVERIIFLFLIFYSFGLANFAENFKIKFLISLVIFFIMLEQIPFKMHYDWTKEEHNKRIEMYKTDKNCKVVTYDVNVEPDWMYLLDIMWASSKNNVYTTNGYSGYIPDISQNYIEGECRYILE